MNGTTTNAHFSVPSLIALCAAIGSFVTGAFWGLILAMVAVLFGVIGVLLALSPRVRGGVVSFVSIFAGAVGIILAGFKALVWLL